MGASSTERAPSPEPHEHAAHATAPANLALHIARNPFRRADYDRAVTLLVRDGRDDLSRRERSKVRARAISSCSANIRRAILSSICVLASLMSVRKRIKFRWLAIFASPKSIL
jgi:hypothetical protein